MQKAFCLKLKLTGTTQHRGQHYYEIDAKSWGKGTTIMVYEKSKIKAIYNTYIKFIKWYNKQKV